ncbi:DUF202 domain-containing protein [Nocardia sp. 004]|uniref:DUF202 domain-containing protein n=1 Tax=Nocardia sp. 004 TaxID=3385978 RepID=UPI0039A28B23
MNAPHLAAERTALAWRRTAVSAIAVSVLFLHAATGITWHPAAIALIGAALAMAALAGACSLRSQGLRRGHFAHGGRSVAVAAVAVGVVALAAFATFTVGLFDPPP